MPDDALAPDPLWYKDAIIYELHVKTFHDSDGDGMGDFRGLIEKLDYLQELGVTAIWLLPFYPSPMRDDGYDIADYFDVNPNYGTLDDFQAFLARRARARAAGDHGTGDQSHLRSESVVPELAPGGAGFAGARDYTSGAIRRRNTRMRGSFSKISRPRTGRGIRSRKPITGTASIRISRI